MIVPKRDAKCYGAVHIDNYLTFTGFCKKVYSDEAQNVDVFLDGLKIATIVADKKIPKIEQIYDIEGHGFEFDLPEKYFEKSHLLEFKASSGEELVNSKIQTIDKNHPKFNEMAFLNSLKNPIDDKFKTIYTPNTIGFLATDINLNDQSFMNFINNLRIRFPSAKLIGLRYESFEGLDSDIQIESVSNMADLVAKCSIFISNRYKNYSPNILLIEKNLAKSDFVNIIVFDERLSTMNLESFDNLVKSSVYDPICDDYLELGLSQNYNRSMIKTMYKEILCINENLDFEEIYIPQYYGDLIEGVLNSKDIKFTLNKIWKLYVENVLS